ncbi:MAG: phage tail sheath subtilisin-like domain-containing protein [bacterium]
MVATPSVTPFVLRTALVGAGAGGGPSAAAGPHGVYALSGGDDGAAPTAASYGEALDRLAEVEGISIVAAPGASYLPDNTPAVLTNARAIRDQLVTHVEADTRYRIAVLDVPQDRTVEEARAWRGEMDSKYAALYHPWLVVANPLTRPGDATIPTELVVPPSGHLCGIYARNDGERGVHKAPANEVVRGVVRFAQSINHAQQELLNPDGINCLRAFTGRGQRVWGARLASSDNEWRYVSDRRYFNYLEASIDRGTQWAVFEPNGDALWADVEQSISEFLYNEWRSGALLGKNPNQAYTVRCDRSVMTQNDLDNGRMICEIGVAIVKPAEFVIFRIGQKTIDANN